MGKEEKSGTALLAGIRDMFGSVEWVEHEAFWTARVWFGEKDYALITVVSGELVWELVAAMAEIEGVRDRFAAAATPEAAADVVAQTITAGGESLWPRVEAIITQCVSKLHMPELAEATSREWSMPNADASAGVRLAFVKRLPIVLTGRLMIGIAVQAGNLLTRSTRV